MIDGASPKGREPLQVLLVDDNLEFATYTKKRLSLRRMAVRVATSGEEALHQLADQPADVVVLDVLMPGMSGVETLRRIRALSSPPPVIMLSGHGTEEAAAAGMAGGAVAYLLKPSSIESLVAAIESALGDQGAG